MQVTIVKDDNAVIVDGKRFTVDCSDLPENFHALQWRDNDGEVEYSTTRCDHCGARTRKANEFVRDFAPYQKYVDAWQLAKTQADAAAALFKPQLAGVSADAAGP